VSLEPDETQGREGMTKHQRTTSILIFATLLVAVLPSAALGNSLLSGYGGPGEGNQAILGSALVNGPKGGGGSGAGSSGGGGENSVGQSSSSQPGEAAATQGGHATARSKHATGGRSSTHAKAAKPAASAAAGRPSATGTVIYPAASSESRVGGSRALGLSGADFVYIIVALGVLALTGFLTVRLARTTATRGPHTRR
jgi:hypothetical protein